MPTENWWFQEPGTVRGIDWSSTADSTRTIRFDTGGTWQVQTQENYLPQSYFQTAPLQDSREFCYAYEPIDISALESILGRLRYDENGNLIFEEPQQEPDICIPKEVMEEVL